MNLYGAVTVIAALLCLQSVHASSDAKCCSGEPIKCPAPEATKYGTVTHTPACCGNGKWYCQRDGKGTASHVCSLEGHNGHSKACPAPAKKCCAGEPIKCPAPETTKFGTVTHTPTCCGNGKWYCQRNGKGTAGHVCSLEGHNGASKACPKPEPVKKCCKGKPIKCPAPETTKFGTVTHTPTCCGNGKWFCQRNGKGTAGHVCNLEGNKGTSKAC